MNFIKKFEAFTNDRLRELIEKDKTYLKKYTSDKTEYKINDLNEYNDLIKLAFEYDISNFNYRDLSYCIQISPDNNFIELLNNINKVSNRNIPLNKLQFTFFVTGDFNMIDISIPISIELRGLGLGYKLYKLLCNRKGFLTSKNGLSTNAYNIWYKLMTDEDFYCFTSKEISGIISKKNSNEYIKIVLNNLKQLDLEFDDELKEKIKEIYGSLDTYK